jgi:hypothetical protein
LFVLAHNLDRRHLDESQRAMIASKVATLKQGRNGGPNVPIGTFKTQTLAAERFNVSLRSVRRASKVQERGSKQLQKAVEDGEIAQPVNKPAQ